MRVMFIQAEPRDDIQDFNFPMGYASLDSVLAKRGHEAELVFTIAYALADSDIARKAKESRAQVFAIGGLFPYLKRVEGMVAMLRQARPDARVVLGGPMVTYVPELVLRKTGADFCVAGEGEVALSSLLDCLEKGTDYSDIKGLVFMRDGRVVNNGVGELTPLEEIPMPNWQKYPMEYYLRIGWYFNSFATGYDRVMGWAASRGCPGKCNFCCSGCAPRYKRIEHLMRELHEIDDRFHPSFLYWMDNLTMGSRGYCKKLCEALIREGFKFKYFITGRVDIVDREMLKLLRESGCACILYGLESANDELLKSMNKNTTVQQFVEAVRLTKEAGIGVNISAMFGQPGETLQDFARTLKMILTASDRTMPYSNNQGFSPLVTFPGAPIYDWARQHGYIKDDEDYYEQFFKYRWINYTQYPREVVEKALSVANLMNTWNFHRNRARSLEDSMFAMFAMPEVNIVSDKRFPAIRKFFRERPRLKRIAKSMLSLAGRARTRLRLVTGGGKSRRAAGTAPGKHEMEAFLLEFIRDSFGS